MKGQSFVSPLSLFKTVFTHRNNSTASLLFPHLNRSSPRHGSCMSMRAFWVLPKTKTVLTTALEANINDFLFTEQSQFDAWSTLGCFNSVLVNTDGDFDGGQVVKIHSAEDVDDLMRRAGPMMTIVMDPTDWKVIPAENLIASFQSTDTKLFAIVQTAEEAKAMFGMLQIGVDGVVLRSDDVNEVLAFAKLKRQLVDMVGQSIPGLSHATITNITPVGAGERVCVDTCSLLDVNEGMMVGNSCQAMFLVLSEAAEVDYVPSRPFRINAGPVHSYCMVPGGKTKYLSELQAGDEVLIAGNGGQTSRTAVVGRAKIETRPLLLVEVQPDTKSSSLCSFFVQNAETVRLAVVDSNGEPAMKGVTTLQPGDQLIMKTDEKARHIGIAIEESLLEK